MRRLTFVVALAACALFAHPARAQDAAAAAADALFQSGKAAMDRGEVDVACDRFRESFRLQAAVGTLLNVGACEEKRRHYAFALQCFRDALALLGAGDFRRSYAEERLAELKRRVAFARVIVEGPPPTSIRLVQDDVELGAASVGIELSIDPGPHVYTASASGFTSERVTVQLSRGEHRDVVLRLKPAPVREAPSEATPAPSSPARESGAGAGPFILMGSGAAAVAAGAVFGVLVMTAASDVRDHCNDAGCDDTGLEAARSGRPFAVLSPIFLGAGAALAGAGVLWWRMSKRNASLTVAVQPGTASFSGTF